MVCTWKWGPPGKGDSELGNPSIFRVLWLLVSGRCIFLFQNFGGFQEKPPLHQALVIQPPHGRGSQNLARAAAGACFAGLAGSGRVGAHHDVLVKLASDRKHAFLGPQKVAFWRGNGTPAISGKSRLVKYFFLARWRAAGLNSHYSPWNNHPVCTWRWIFGLVSFWVSAYFQGLWLINFRESNFHINRRWSSTQFSRGLYTHCKVLPP